VLSSALVILLTVVAVSSGAERELDRELGGFDVPTWVVDYVVTFVFLVALVMVVGVAAATVVLRPKWHIHYGPMRLSLVWLMALIVATGGYFAITRAVWDIEVREPTRKFAQQAERRMRQADERPQRARSPQIAWPLVIGAGAVAAGIAGFYVWSRRRRLPLLSEEQLAEELRVAVDETLDDLRRERDPRRAVIAAYARMERTLAGHGFPRRPFEAPFEYLSRILLGLQLRAGTVFALTELFERAKFSRHEIDRSMKDEAIAALVSVRDELRPSTP
jgi:Domain of unknown function (DUF4129)